MVAGGIFAGFFLLAIEIAFKRRKERREKELQVSKNALVHWRKKIEVNQTVLINRNNCCLVDDSQSELVINRNYDVCLTETKLKINEETFIEKTDITSFVFLF